MNRKLWLCAGTVLLMTLLAIPGTSAGEERGWYAGIGAGSADDDLLSESDTAFKAFGGFRFSKIVAVEAAAVDLGEYLFGTLEQSGLAVVGEATLPLGDKFGVFGKAGIFLWEVEIGPYSEDDADTTFGLGGKVALGTHWAIRAEWERFNDISGGDVDLVSGSVYYRF